MALLYLAVLALFGWLMITRRLTATLALPLTALSIAAIVLAQALLTGAAEPDGPILQSLIQSVVETGIGRLSTAIFAVILGAVLAAQLRLSGAAERLVRYAAEYAGEDRFWLGFTLLLVIGVLFTVLGGLGAVILVASVTLPLLLTLGYEPKVAGALFLFGLSLGGTLNPANWALYRDILQLPQQSIVAYAVVLFSIFLAVAVAYLLLQDRSSGLLRRLAVIGAIAAALGLAALAFRQWPAAWTALKTGLAWLMLAVLILLALALAARWIIRGVSGKSTWLAGADNWLTALGVLVPLLLLLHSGLRVSLDATAAQVPILTALLAGIVYVGLATFDRDGAALNRLMRALHEGVSHAAPAVVLLIGIGLLLQAVSLPQVQGTLEPLIVKLPVQAPLLFVATFFLLSPLALYRGPLNLFGMGAPVVGIMAGSGILEAPLIMVAFFSVGMLQGVCDPTNTHNVWIGSFCRVPVAELTRHTLPWVLAIVLGGLVAGAVIFRTAFGQ